MKSQWPMVKLNEACSLNMGQSPDSSGYNDEGRGIPFYQGNADFGALTPVTRFYCDNPTKIAHRGDILLSVRAPIGAVNIANETCCIGRGLAALTACDSVDAKFLYYAIKSKHDELNAKGTGSTFKAINKKALHETQIPLPVLAEQKNVASILDNVSGLAALRKRQIMQLDLLAKSRFIEMFGDPVENPKKWATCPLSTLGTFKNGMNFSSNERGIEIRCLGVGDFKNLSIINTPTKLPIISLAFTPSAEYLLQDGDIIFVRSNGNKALVGRCVAIYTHGLPVTFSGFCIRFRVGSDAVNIMYLLRVLKADTIRKKMAGRGANIQNLNQKILARLAIPIPPLALQNEFAAFIEQLDKSKFSVSQQQKTIDSYQRGIILQLAGGE